MSEHFAYRCVLVLGATAGLGRALASAIHDLPSQPRVIVTGRRTERLDELVRDKGSDRIVPRAYDQSVSPAEIKTWVQHLLRDEPTVDCVIFMAGIQIAANPSDPEAIERALEEEMRINYFAVVAGMSAFTPHLLSLGKKQQPNALITVTSGLSMVPMAQNALYCATKAAMRSYTLSAREALRPHGVKVIEILPPLVESELHEQQGTTAALSKIWMPLQKFTEATMAGLLAGDEEIPVGMAKDSWEKYEQGKAAEVRKRGEMMTKARQSGK